MALDSDAVRPVGSSLPGVGVYPTSSGKSHIRPDTKQIPKKKEKGRNEESPKEGARQVDHYA